MLLLTSGAFEMRLCPKCGTPMERNDVDNKSIWICPVCGYTIEDKRVSVEEIKKSGLSIKSETKVGEGIIEEKTELGALSTISSCPKCGHSPVYYTAIQSRAADEPPVRIYKCPKCGYSWREYS